MSLFEAGVPALVSREAGPSTALHHKMLIDLFLTLQMLGFVGSCALVLTTTLSSRAPRNATWQNFFTAWIVSTVSYSLLLFSGQLNNPKPSFGVCLAQSGLIYGIPSLNAATAFGLIAQIWFSVQTVLSKKIKYERLWIIGLLILPYAFLVAIVVAAWTTGIRNSGSVELIGSGMYCHLGHSATLGRVSAAIVALLLIPTLALEIAICVALRRNWGTFKKMRNSLSIIMRVVIFTIFGTLAIGVSGVFVFSDAHGAALNIVLAILPVTAVVVFATQKDIIRVWMFWKRPLPADEKSLDDSSPRSSKSSAPPV
ncbi:hypothetical protein R3P38DRAFT_3168291 [Favolaschia claudopus]|uniref:G-protein coupled receptors family 2 profile 2 domain-containing protein n=1 Tax=Favolaschia claudopus TaxID=2862362 RepID=A0AAW0E3J3_9AGAR